MNEPLILTPELQQAVKKYGTPLTLEDDDGKKYVLIEVVVLPMPDNNGYQATLEGLDSLLCGKGQTKREAQDALYKELCELR